jgi:hypothetical protein
LGPSTVKDTVCKANKTGLRAYFGNLFDTDGCDFVCRDACNALTESGTVHAAETKVNKSARMKHENMEAMICFG